MSQTSRIGPDPATALAGIGLRLRRRPSMRELRLVIRPAPAGDAMARLDRRQGLRLDGAGWFGEAATRRETAARRQLFTTEATAQGPPVIPRPVEPGPPGPPPPWS